MQQKISISHHRGGGAFKDSLKSFLDSIGLLKPIQAAKRFLCPPPPVPPFIPNVNKTNYDKKCLLIYITHPFVWKINDTHQNQWQAAEMARIIGTFGYNVDVASCFREDIFNQINNKYDLIIDIISREKNFWSHCMNEGCKIIMYATGSSHKFSYEQELQRLADLEQRRGVKLQLVRSSLEGTQNEREIENANLFWSIGNSYNLKSYDYLHIPPVCYIKNNGYNFDWLNLNITRNKKNFLYFASSGQVHKGLDLLLEIFSKPGFEYNLYICSSLTREYDFCKEYKRELFEIPNIHTIGFIDINGSEFRELTEKCAYSIMPSCSEGLAGSILTVMSAGVIPIVSKECGFEDDEVINLPDCKIDTIEKFIRNYSAKPDEWIKQESSHVVEIVKTRYSRQNFTDSVIAAMNKLASL